MNSSSSLSEGLNKGSNHKKIIDNFKKLIINKHTVSGFLFEAYPDLDDGSDLTNQAKFIFLITF